MCDLGVSAFTLQRIEARPRASEDLWMPVFVLGDARSLASAELEAWRGMSHYEALAQRSYRDYTDLMSEVVRGGKTALHPGGLVEGAPRTLLDTNIREIFVPVPGARADGAEGSPSVVLVVGAGSRGELPAPGWAGDLSEALGEVVSQVSEAVCRRPASRHRLHDLLGSLLCALLQPKEARLRGLAPEKWMEIVCQAAGCEGVVDVKAARSEFLRCLRSWPKPRKSKRSEEHKPLYGAAWVLRSGFTLAARPDGEHARGFGEVRDDEIQHELQSGPWLAGLRRLIASVDDGRPGTRVLKLEARSGRVEVVHSSEALSDAAPEGMVLRTSPRLEDLGDLLLRLDVSAAGGRLEVYCAGPEPEEALASIRSGAAEDRGIARFELRRRPTLAEPLALVPYDLQGFFVQIRDRSVIASGRRTLPSRATRGLRGGSAPKVTVDLRASHHLGGLFTPQSS